jgi:hypothetical protein
MRSIMRWSVVFVGVVAAALELVVPVDDDLQFTRRGLGVRFQQRGARRETCQGRFLRHTSAFRSLTLLHGDR